MITLNYTERYYLLRVIMLEATHLRIGSENWHNLINYLRDLRHESVPREVLQACVDVLVKEEWALSEYYNNILAGIDNAEMPVNSYTHLDMYYYHKDAYNKPFLWLAVPNAPGIDKTTMSLYNRCIVCEPQEDKEPIVMEYIDENLNKWLLDVKRNGGYFIYQDFWYKIIA